MPGNTPGHSFEVFPRIFLRYSRDYPGTIPENSVREIEIQPGRARKVEIQPGRDLQDFLVEIQRTNAKSQHSDRRIERRIVANRANSG